MRLLGIVIAPMLNGPMVRAMRDPARICLKSFGIPITVPHTSTASGVDAVW